MANVKFYRGEKDNLPLKGEDGAIYVTSDSKEIYVDTQTTTANASNVESVMGRIRISDTSKAPINHANIGTLYGVSTDQKYGHAKASSTTPKPNGSASVGSETSSFARGDHVHPLQTSVANATKATQDSAGQQIDSTYIKGLSVSGKTITYTKGDGSTGRITTQDTDTTYEAATSSNLGLIKSGGDVSIDSSGIVTVVDDSHIHSNSTISSLDASKLTGTISIDRLPKGALERLITVENQAERFSLTSSEVQLGDTVKQLDTGTMYLVVNESELDNNSGYTEYTAGRATSVPWAGIEDRPSTFTPSPHTHQKFEITDFPSAIKNPNALKFTGAATGTYDGSSALTINIPTSGAVDQSLIIKLNGGSSEGSNMFTFNGSEAKTVNITAALIGAATSGHTHGLSSISASGFLRQLSGNTTEFLRGDGTWATPPNDTYSNMSGATTSAAGKSGLVPAPSAGSPNRFLRSDGTWATPQDTTYNLGSFGITVSAEEINYLDGVTSKIQEQLDEKANSEHSHSASDITSGILTVARGGTGISSNPSLLVDLGSTTATNVFTASPRPGITGTLPVSHGGTGATSAASARSSLGITPANIGAASSEHSHENASTTSSGFLRQLSGSTAQYLRGDGLWAIPANTDTKVTNTLATMTKAYITGTTSASTNTGTQVFDTGVYLTTTAGQLNVNSLSIGGSAILSYSTARNAVMISFD